jgi:hypothetical protein
MLLNGLGTMRSGLLALVSDNDEGSTLLVGGDLSYS